MQGCGPRVHASRKVTIQPHNLDAQLLRWYTHYQGMEQIYSNQRMRLLRHLSGVALMLAQLEQAVLAEPLSDDDITNLTREFITSAEITRAYVHSFMYPRFENV